MEYLAHHGTKGMKWGVRRYQNYDGSLTDEGRRRYGLEGKKPFRATENVKEAGRRSAKASAKASFKGNIKRAAAYSLAGAALGAASLGTVSVAALPLVGATAAGAFVADMATHTALGAIMGRTYGRKAAREQDLEIQKRAKNGESFVLEKITATSTAKSTWYGTSVKTRVSSEKLDTTSKESMGLTDDMIKRTPRTAYATLHNNGYTASEASKIIGQSSKDNKKPSGELRAWANKYGVNKNDIAGLKARQDYARSLKNSGYTIAEIADKMNAPFNSVKDYLYEDIDSLH